MKSNIDTKVVDGFGDEWIRFNQELLNSNEAKIIFDKYFFIFPWETINKNAVGFDLGCGSGRWAKLVAPKVGHLHCIDPSEAIEVAKNNLRELDNCSFQKTSVDSINLKDNSMDFGYSLGVLHHVPDTLNGIKCCVDKLKQGAPFLIYLYYKLENKPNWYKLMWRSSETIRAIVSKSPHNIRYLISQIMAFVIYFPLARFANLLELLGFSVGNFPLSAYRNYSFYTIRTDALDRFGTRLEQRFSKEEIKNMMENSGLINVEFSPFEPFWCAIGYKK
jgi:ubiquinone/menaquinone biosynthesis C-methylase UbiE